MRVFDNHVKMSVARGTFFLFRDISNQNEKRYISYFQTFLTPARNFEIFSHILRYQSGPPEIICSSVISRFFV